MFRNRAAKFVALCILLSSAIAAAHQPLRLYLKNNSQYVAFIWIGLKYAGYLEPDKVADLSSRGEVPLDDKQFSPPSFGSTGRELYEEQHRRGGWFSNMSGPSILGPSIPVQIWLQLPQREWLSTKIDVAADEDGKAYIWFGDKTAGKEPEATEWQNGTALYYYGIPKPDDDQPSNGPAYAATRPATVNDGLLKIVNAKFRSGDYQAALDDLKTAQAKAAPNSQEAKVIEKMISELNNFLNKKR